MNDVKVAIASAKMDLESAQAGASRARSAFVALLPIATPEQAAACVKSAADIEIGLALSGVTSRLNQDYRLTEEQADQVAAAKANHKLTINEPAMKQEAATWVMNARLKSYKLTTRKDGRVALAISGVI